MPTRGYIAGKPVSRWEAADSDNIDIEYKNLDRPGKQSGWPCGDCFSGTKGELLSRLLLLQSVDCRLLQTLSACLSLCVCVCLSHFYSLYHSYYGSDFDQTG